MASTQRSEFYKATDRMDRQFGENNCPEFTYNGFTQNGSDLAPIVAIHKQITRGTDVSQIKELCDNALRQSHINGNSDIIKNLFKMWIHKRWTRGGEGEKRIFYESQAYLINIFPDIVIDLVPLYPLYGYWKDMLELMKVVNKYDNIPQKTKSNLRSNYCKGICFRITKG